MKKQICNNCEFYTAYYKQLSSMYMKTPNGLCEKHQRILPLSKRCPDFKDNEERELRRQERRMTVLDQSLKSINEIAQILAEKQIEASLE